MITLHFVIRVLHVLLGAFWTGAVMLLAFFIVPAVEDSGPAGGAVMQALMKRAMPRTLTFVGLFTVLTGIYLLWELSAHFSSAFMGSTPGMLLSTGALLGIIALLIGVHVSRPTANKLGEIGQRVGASGAPPTPEDVAEMARLRGRLAMAARVMAVALIVTVVCMALAPHI
jgi:uncharacterized membrane protein